METYLIGLAMLMPIMSPATTPQKNIAQVEIKQMASEEKLEELDDIQNYKLPKIQDLADDVADRVVQLNHTLSQQ